MCWIQESTLCAHLELMWIKIKRIKNMEVYPNVTLGYILYYIVEVFYLVFVTVLSSTLICILRLINIFFIFFVFYYSF